MLQKNLDQTLELLEKGPSQRQLRVAETLKHAIAKSLNSHLIHDDLLARAMLTVTRIKVSPDLKVATVFVTPLNKDLATDKELKEALKSSIAEIKRYISREIVMKYSPRLTFQVDHNPDHVDRVNHLFNDPRVRQDVAV